MDDFAALGVRVAAVSYDGVETLAGFAEDKGIRYTLLADEETDLIETLGIRNEEYGEDHFAHGVPHPGVLFVDPAGVVRLKRAVPGYRDRPPFDELLEAVGALVRSERPPAATQSPPEEPE